MSLATAPGTFSWGTYLKILAYQPLIQHITSVKERRSHVERMVRKLVDRCQQEDDIAFIMLPELATVEYSPDSFEKIADFSELIDGETYQAMAALAARTGCAVAYGFPQELDGNYFISQAVVDRSGQLITVYNKIHLAQMGASMEQDYFSCGDKLSVFEIGGFRIGLVICYDFRFSGLIKQLVSRYEVDVILHPVAFQKDGTYRSWHHFVIARALEYQVYFLSLNRAGKAYGDSILCPPWIDDHTNPLILGEDEEIVTFRLVKQIINSVRELYPLRKDLRSDYSRLGT